MTVPKSVFIKVLRKLTTNLAISRVDDLAQMFLSMDGQIYYMSFIDRINKEISSKFQKLEQTNILNEFLGQANLAQRER